MISRRLKASYYSFLHYPMRLNALRHRVVPSRWGNIKVQLGPGQRNYIDGWVNVDANFITARIDIWADISGKLPFRNGSVDAFYSNHVIEHLPDQTLPFHFAEMFRCLRNGGVIRVGGPNADSAIRKFQENDAAWFSDFPDKRRSIGGKFANFILCRGEHLTILTSSYMTEIASDAGFQDIKFCSRLRRLTFRRSSISGLSPKNRSPPPRSRTRCLWKHAGRRVDRKREDIWTPLSLARRLARFMSKRSASVARRHHPLPT
jgi:predicted SAM-dependent methyltransferase